MLMLVGPSGCGKTTLISVIAGTLRHDEGECIVLGENLKEMTMNRQVEWRGVNIGFVFQQFNLIPQLTAAENVAVPLMILGEMPRVAIARGAEMLERVGLSNKADSLPAELSGGQQQRVAVARALIHRPSLIVCDEPTSALDAQTGRMVMGILREMVHQEGTTLLIVTHDARIFSYADAIVRMNDGIVEGMVTEQELENYEH
jgi:putative ABC transport system ATP-binding protein